MKFFQMKMDLWLSKLKGKKYILPVPADCLEESNNGTGVMKTYSQVHLRVSFIFESPILDLQDLDY
jgi:hypothetical protein